jgi:hypothetical protein
MLLYKCRKRLKRHLSKSLKLSKCDLNKADIDKHVNDHEESQADDAQQLSTTKRKMLLYFSSTNFKLELQV